MGGLIATIVAFMIGGLVVSTAGWQPRPGRETVVDCGRSLLDSGVV
jgi:hypothetical protein